jgi:hypothetical protein
MTMPNPFDGVPYILAERSGLTGDQLAPNFERETGLDAAIRLGGDSATSNQLNSSRF